MTTAYITKKALTDGIVEKEGELLDNGKYFSVENYGFFSANDFYLDIESAKQKAEQMRIKKINSLRKQLEKLEKLSFQ